jgi:hypothetical protein
MAELKTIKAVTKAEIDDFRPPYPGDAPLVSADYVALYRNLDLLDPPTKPGATSLVSQATRLAALDVVHPLGEGEGIGSNNWVVAGTRSQSGKPMLANDPHLGLTTPSVWYFARMSAPGLQVFGATFPGLPYVVLGRNEHVAWSATNTGPEPDRDTGHASGGGSGHGTRATATARATATGTDTDADTCAVTPQPRCMGTRVPLRFRPCPWPCPWPSGVCSPAFPG